MTDIIKEIGYLAGGSRLRRIYEKLQQGGDKVYRDAGLQFKSSWFPVYYVLARAKKPLTVMEITAQIAFSHITVKNILRELQKKELINIRVNPYDKRSKLITLSRRGKALEKKLEPLWTSFAAVLKDVFSSAHPEITSILTDIDEALDEVSLDERVRRLSRKFVIRRAHPKDFQTIGRLMVNVYANLDGFPSAKEQPKYYRMLANIGTLTKQPATELLIAVAKDGTIGGAVVYFSDMKYYGSRGTATAVQNASGFRLLAVDLSERGQGLGKLLSKACIEKARQDGNRQLVIHTTKAMEIAWKMYENLGFKRSQDLDFLQGELAVFGFRLNL